MQLTSLHGKGLIKQLFIGMCTLIFQSLKILNRAEAERLAAERLLEEAKALIEDAKIRVDKDEVEVDTKLKLRTGDVEFWRGELDNKLSQLKDEISNMSNLKIRVDSEARSCTEPINITQQCMTFR